VATDGSGRPAGGDANLRVAAGHGVARGPKLTILMDGRPVTAYPGETVAGALMAAGRRVLRTTTVRGEPRGVFCGMGVCYDCLMVIDGRSSRRACVTFVEDGMRVETQAGVGEPT
jgi:predicted molibdopterin-dependent oxidoreductase YjgC